MKKIYANPLENWGGCDYTIKYIAVESNEKD